MDFVTGKLGRWIYALPFAIFGVFHMINAAPMAAMVPKFLPGGVIWVYATGAMLIAAALSFFIGKFTKLAGVCLAMLLCSFIGFVHVPALLGGTAPQHLILMNMLKDFALAGGALMAGGAGGGAGTFRIKNKATTGAFKT